MTDLEMTDATAQERPDAWDEVGSLGEARISRVSNAPDASPEGRRAHPRFTVDLEVTVMSEHNFYAGFLENLSVGGVFIATHRLKPVGSEIEISINLPDREEPVRGVGEVRWIREYHENSDVSPGMGVKFVKLENGADEAITEFLEARDPLFWED